MDISGNVAHTVTFFQGAFTIVLALSLGEALKAFVAEDDVRPIHWDRTPAFMSFLLIFFPFFQSMSQYLYLTYLNAATAPKFYPGFLVFDGILFTLESACFFVMSRALGPRHWRRFYTAVLLLMAIDIVWSGVTYSRGIHVGAWIWIDLGIAAVLGAVLFIERDRHATAQAARRATLLCLATMVVSTGLSYWLEREIYFP